MDIKLKNSAFRTIWIDWSRYLVGNTSNNWATWSAKNIQCAQVILFWVTLHWDKNGIEFFYSSINHNHMNLLIVSGIILAWTLIGLYITMSWKFPTNFKKCIVLCLFTGPLIGPFLGVNILAYYMSERQKSWSQNVLNRLKNFYNNLWCDVFSSFINFILLEGQWASCPVL